MSNKRNFYSSDISSTVSSLMNDLIKDLESQIQNSSKSREVNSGILRQEEFSPDHNKFSTFKNESGDKLYYHFNVSGYSRDSIETWVSNGVFNVSAIADPELVTSLTPYRDKYQAVVKLPLGWEVSSVKYLSGFLRVELNPEKEPEKVVIPVS